MEKHNENPKEKNKKVAVLGAGSWGTALSSVLAENGYDVMLWARRAEVAREINEQHTNSAYLPNATIPLGVQASSLIAETVSSKDAVFFVVPSQWMREVAREVKKWIDPDTLVIHASKGFEMDTWKRMSEVLREELQMQSSVLSGPSHAEEVIHKHPTTVVVASPSLKKSMDVQALLTSSYFRVYTNPDPMGVEIGGALKNVIAIATGLADGLQFGDNTKAALITRGLNEIMRLGKAMGADPMTFLGLAGVGDLMVTCTSQHSRNWRAGYALGQGASLKQVLLEMNMVVEGVKATKAAHALSRQYGVEMPLTEQLHAVLFEDKNPSQAVRDLMSRGKTGEFEEIG